MANKDQKKKTCFVICPIGADKSASRERSDKVLKYIVRPVLEAANYHVERADQIDEPGIITNQIVKKIIESDILIADLSEGNPNVFYELAIRHGLKKPFIYMIDSSEKIPFDNSQVRTIQFDIRDLDSVDAAKRQLQSQVGAIDGGDTIAESPISVAFDLEALKAGGGDSNLLATLLDEVMVLGREVRAMKKGESLKLRKKYVIEDKADLIRHLRISGQIGMADYVEENISHVYGGESNISIISSMSPELEARFINDLSAALVSATGRTWTVDVMPF